MSDTPVERFFAADTSAAAGIAREIFVAGGAPRLAERLLQELTADSTWAREQALERLCSLSDYEPLLDTLSASLADDDDAERRNAARSALAALAAPGAGAPAAALRRLHTLLGDRSEADVRLLAASALGESGNPAAREALELALDDPEPNVVSAAADALGIIGDPRALPALARVSGKGEFWTRVSAVVALGRMRDVAAVPALTEALREPWLTSAAAGALGEIGDPTALESLRSLIEGENGGRDEAVRAAVAIFSSHPDTPVPAWLRAGLRRNQGELEQRLVDDGDPDAGRQLGLIGSPAAAEALVGSLGTPGHEDAVSAGLPLLPPAVAEEAIVRRLTGEDDTRRVLLLGALPPLQSPAAVEVVCRKLASPDPEVRAAAADVLGRTPEELVLPALQRAGEMPEAQHGVALVYARLGRAHCDPLVELLRSESPRVRSAAAEGLARCGDAYVRQLREAIRREGDREALYSLARALGASRTVEAVEELIPLLSHEDPGLRFAAVQALGRTRLDAAFEPLVSALSDPREEIRASALAALGEIGDPRAGQPLVDHLGVPDRDLRRTAIFALDRLDRPEVAEQLLRALRDPDREVRLTAVRVLHRLRTSKGLLALQQVAEMDPEVLVRRAAGRALADLSAADERGRG